MNSFMWKFVTCVFVLATMVGSIDAKIKCHICEESKGDNCEPSSSIARFFGLAFYTEVDVCFVST